MKNILITSDCFVDGVPASKGDVLLDVNNSISAELLTSGRAILAPKEEAPKPAPKKASKKAAKKKLAQTDES